MIIKSMSRKEPTFGELIEYMTDVEKSDEKYFVFHNVFSRKQADLEAEFLANAALIRQRKNGLYLYHEILSIKAAQNLSKAQQKELLREIAQQYAEERAGNCLVFGALHDDHDEHLHYHLLISANYAAQAKKHRMSRAEFDSFKKDLEASVLTNYPQLEQQLTIGRESGEKLSNRGGERKRRTGETPQRDTLKTKLTEIFASTHDKQSFFEALNAEGLQVYARGNTIGIRDTATDRPHRLKTLGLLDAFHEMSARIELSELPKAERRKAKPKGTEQEKSRATSDSDTASSGGAEQAKPQAKTNQNHQNTEKPEANRNTQNAQNSQNTRNSENIQKPQLSDTPNEPELSTAEREAARRKAKLEALREEQTRDSEQSKQQSDDERS